MCRANWHILYNNTRSLTQPEIQEHVVLYLCFHVCLWVPLRSTRRIHHRCVLLEFQFELLYPLIVFCFPSPLSFSVSKFLFKWSFARLLRQSMKAMIERQLRMREKKVSPCWCGNLYLLCWHCTFLEQTRYTRSNAHNWISGFNGIQSFNPNKSDILFVVLTK